MRRGLLLMMAAVVAIASCSDGPTESEDGPGIRIIAGAGSTDTVSSRPTQGLVVEVRDESGKPAAGVEVRFESNDAGGMGISGISDTYWYSVRGATTDANGRATVRVAYGNRAGPAWIAASVPLYNLTDTARYTIAPGAAERVILAPKDTVLTPGASFTYRGAVADRFGNPRPDVATYEALGTAVTVTTVGNASAAGFGIATVKARATINGVALVDSGTVAVVPVATIAWNSAYTQLAVSSLSGENKKTIAAAGLAPSWEPGGNRFVITNSGLVIVDANGNGTPLPTPGFINATWPEWSADGFIYFHGDIDHIDRRVARIRPDGTGLDTLTAAAVGASMPSPSPDGSRIVYVAGSTGLLSVSNIATGSRTTFTGTEGAKAPRWSPDGQWIAYTTYEGPLMLVRPDGTGLHRIGTHGMYPGITWSPDSKWILGSDGVITDVVTGKSAKLATLPQMTYPAWKRGP